MNLLLDTHAFLWFAIESLSKNLPPATRDVLEDKDNKLYLSMVSPWEAAIKISIGKLNLPQPIQQIVQTQVTSNDLNLLDIKLSHLDLVQNLPFHHKDPFDRLLIAQAQIEGFQLLSIDDVFDRYDIKRLWLI